MQPYFMTCVRIRKLIWRIVSIVLSESRELLNKNRFLWPSLRYPRANNLGRARARKEYRDDSDESWECKCLKLSLNQLPLLLFKISGVGGLVAWYPFVVSTYCRSSFLASIDSSLVYPLIVLPSTEFYLPPGFSKFSYSLWQLQ